MLSYVEVPLLVIQIERASVSTNISSNNLQFLSDLNGRLSDKGNQTRIKAAEIDRLHEIFCDTGVYHGLDPAE